MRKHCDPSCSTAHIVWFPTEGETVGNLKCQIAGVVAVSLLVFCVSPAISGERDHEGGFFLRLAAGAGPAGTKFSNDTGDSVDLSGLGVDVEIAIGGVITPNLALHGTLWGWTIAEPDAEVVLGGGIPVTGKLRGDLRINAVGIGLTYYFMPINLYLTGSVGFGSLTIDLETVSGESDTGVIVEAAVGKEWFVSNRWGLGVAVGVTVHSMPDAIASEKWSGISIPVRFSATFN